MIDNLFVMFSAALVMLMIPGLAFFYSGMVRHKNVISTIMHSYMKLALISVLWFFVGYTLVFDNSIGGIIGGLDYAFMENLDVKKDLNIDHIIFVCFQCMFAVITIAIITGSFAERVRLSSSLIFSTFWLILVYCPVAHWIWGGGWIAKYFIPLDFAGGTVVHISSATSGLVAAIMLGKRVENHDNIKPHNIPFAILGASMLWFGWFGFNAGSALSVNKIAGFAFANTHIAACAGSLGWYMTERIKSHKVSAIGLINGSIAGLVGITPAAGFVGILPAFFIGFVAAILCYIAVSIIKPFFKYDDSLDAFGIHGIGGFWGAIATGIFSSTAINPSGQDGLLYGNYNLIFSQIISNTIVIVYVTIMTFLIIKFLRIFIKMRVTESEEKEGLDKTIHGEIGYNEA